MGRRGSRISIGMAWALASSTPLRYFKGFHSEGGIRVPLIVSGPGVARAGQLDPAFIHVMDIAPTLLEVARASHPYPDKYSGRQVQPLGGTSMVPFLAGKTHAVRDDTEALAWESLGKRAVRQGRWKATWLGSPFGPDDWQLFDLAADISERNDLANKNKEKLNELIRFWEKYSDDVGVVLPTTTLKLDD
jgi:arylsulfatase A-like enzyme